jgi:hypothetical protein
MAEASRIIDFLAMSAGWQAPFKPLLYLGVGCFGSFDP